ncbi:hypothetical protein SKAU_G00019570 [Synaphobranchus kaupii]|uniref:DUF4371 domain-containing protein n=1 Tax=Synaphobranchus kaupii TaxID=118154 RepID=A0A9Q1JEE6_SYNKA|nr:hypothetical protein SKAU_G00019570 [Synaphobranchus kaupii]
MKRYFQVLNQSKGEEVQNQTPKRAREEPNEKSETREKIYREAPEKIRVENPYVVGNNILKRDNIKKHSTSHRHILARDAFIAKQHPERAGTLLHSLRTQATKADDAALREVKMKMNVAYCIAKEELPFNKFKPLILLCKKNGADISPSYHNHVRCGEMIETIADEMKSDLAEEIGGSRYLSVMIDGDTDASNKECEMVYVRIIINGKPTNKLIGQQEQEHSHALDPKSKRGTPTPTAFEKTQTKANPTDPKSKFGTPTAAAPEKTVQPPAPISDHVHTSAASEKTAQPPICVTDGSAQPPVCVNTTNSPFTTL